MSNWHVLTKDAGGYRLAYHIAIPATNNAAGTPVRTAVINSGAGGTTALSDGDGTAGTIASAEKTSITTGAVVERLVTVAVPPSLAAASIPAYIDADYAANAAALLAELQARLAQFGRVSAT